MGISILAHQRKPRPRGASLIALAFLSGSGVLANPTECSDQSIMIDGADLLLEDRLCAIAVDVRDELSSCGLEQLRPVKIEIVDKLFHPMGDCLAEYDCADDIIRLIDPLRYSELLAEEAPYSKLPEEVTLKALLSHEMAHALASQMAADSNLEMVDQEYIASAMELELMADQWREVYIEAAPVALPPSEGLIDIWIYAFAPRKFAVNVWQHFRLPENGCDLIRRIASGNHSFSDTARRDLR